MKSKTGTFSSIVLGCCQRKNHTVIIKRILDFQTRKESFLDVGCGDGGLCYSLKERFHGLIVGIDIGNEILIAHKKYRNIAFIKADAQFLPFVGEIFDFVVSSCALEHIYNPENVLEETKRTLCPFGKMLVVVPSSLWHLSNTALFLIILLFWRLLNQALKNKRMIVFVNQVRNGFQKRRFGVFLHAKNYSFELEKYKGYTLITEMVRWKYDRWFKLFLKTGFRVLRTEGIQFVMFPSNFPAPSFFVSLEENMFLKHLCQHFLFVLMKENI